MTKKTVVVGMSGGVDSSVAAWLLKEQGYHVVGLFMKNWEDDDDDEYCSSRQDLIDAVSAAEMIGIDIEAVNFAKEYKERVFSYFLQEYQQARTPNPDILCNSEIKFDCFLQHAIKMGADHIATGHYAKVDLEQTDWGNLFVLKKAIDSTKDQSYFLHRLNQIQLSKTLFPLGDLLKSNVRELAQQIGLANALKKDSTGICFIGERPFREFLSRYLPHQPGQIRDKNSGKVLGKHLGLAFYTLGQRKGLGLGGQKGGSGQPWYTVDKDMKTNTLWVVQGENHQDLWKSSLVSAQTHWILGEPQSTSVLSAKTRYRQPDHLCRIDWNDKKNINSSSTVQVFFEQPQWAVTPGQSVVFYSKNWCLGGGVIDFLDGEKN
jgi:tRNA-specific 2-thiouridylase